MNRGQLARDELIVRQRQDRLECAGSAENFIDRHVSIEDTAGRVMRFRLWPFQRQTLRALHTGEKLIVLKARRLGLSWLVLAYALWLAIFQQGSRIFILCKKEGDAAKLLDRVRRMRDRIASDPASAHLLAGLPETRKSRDAVTTLDVGASTIVALVATADAARQETAAFVVLDEFAFARDAEGIWRAVLPTTEGGGRLAVVSTGNGTVGRGAEFAKQWSRARSGISGFEPLFWPWDAEPSRDQDWRRRKIDELGSEESFRVEYPESPEDAFLTPDATQVIPLSGIDAAEALGRAWRALTDRGDFPAPKGEALALGIDWGERTQAYVVWPLEAGGIYIPPSEVSLHGAEPGESTLHMLKQAARHRWPLTQARYDAAGIQSMRTFLSVARQHHPELRSIKVPFGQYKEETIGYLRRLFRRAAQGKTTGVIAIDPDNVELLRQLRGWLLADDDSGKVEKGDDHGPDALIAGAAPIAHRYRALVEG